VLTNAALKVSPSKLLPSLEKLSTAYELVLLTFSLIL